MRLQVRVLAVRLRMLGVRVLLLWGILCVLQVQAVLRLPLRGLMQTASKIKKCCHMCGRPRSLCQW